MNKRITAFILVLGLCLPGWNAWAAESPPEPATGLHIGGQAPSADLPESVKAATDGYPWRGILLGADHGSTDIHHDNIYVQIDGGPIIYQTTIPAVQTGNLLTDAGLLWHFFTRDQTEFTVYAASAYESGLSSELSDPFPLFFSYPQPPTCTEQTVPTALAGDDQLVNVGTQVTLDASQSFDPFIADNQDLVYRWECYGAPESAVTLSDSGQTAVVTFTPAAAGNYYFRLNVRDQVDGSSFNRSQVSYVRVTAVTDLDTASFISANAGRPQQATVGQTVTLDGSLSQGSSPVTSYHWEHRNPLGTDDINSMANLLGTTLCQGDCYKANYDANAQVDGVDLALLAANYGQITLPDQAVVQFDAGIARPHIFRLTVSDGSIVSSETTIVAVNHPAAEPVLTHPPMDSECAE